MSTFPFSLDDIKVPEKLFDKIVYFSSGQIDSKYLNLLEKGGGKQFGSYFASVVTHFFVGQGANEHDIENAKAIFDLPIVRPEWIAYCAKVGRLISVDGFCGEKDQLFSTVVAAVSGITGQDLKSLWASISFYGGRLTRKLSNESTHLICNNSNSRAYTIAKQKNISVVRLDWVSASITQGILVDVSSYDPPLFTRPRRNVPRPQYYRPPPIRQTASATQIPIIQTTNTTQIADQTASTTQITNVLVNQQDLVTTGSTITQNQSQTMQPGIVTMAGQQMNQQNQQMTQVSQPLVSQQQQNQPINTSQLGNVVINQQGMVSMNSLMNQNQMMQPEGMGRQQLISQQQQMNQLSQSLMTQKQQNQFPNVNQVGNMNTTNQQQGIVSTSSDFMQNQMMETAVIFQEQQPSQILGQQMGQQISQQNQQMTQLSQSFMPQQQNQTASTAQIIPNVMVNQQGMVFMNSVNQMMQPGSMIPQQQLISQQMSQSQPFSSWSQVGNVNMMNQQQGMVSMSSGVNQNEMVPTTVIVLQQQPPQMLGQQMGQQQIPFHSAGPRFDTIQPQQQAKIINQIQMSPQIKAQWHNMNAQQRTLLIQKLVQCSQEEM